MRRNRVGEERGSYDAAGGYTVDTARRTALLTIEEVLGEGVSRSPGRRNTCTVPASVPTSVPPGTVNPSRCERPARRWRVKRRSKRLPRRRATMVALTLGLALCVGAVVGSGALNSQDRYNAQLVAAQEGVVEVYELPEVQGHPGAVPSRERSTSIREFLGMASVF